MYILVYYTQYQGIYGPYDCLQGLDLVHIIIF